MQGLREGPTEEGHGERIWEKATAHDNLTPGISSYDFVEVFQFLTSASVQIHFLDANFARDPFVASDYK